MIFYASTPYGGYKRREKTCGAGIDLDEGGSLFFTPGAKISGDGCQKCVGGCYYQKMEPNIDAVEKVGEAPQDRSIGTYEFRDQFVAQIGDACRATYTIGIVAVDPAFLEDSDESIASDYMLYRQISIGNSDACPGIPQLAAPGTCWDSWSVRVFDERGQMVTRDITERPEASDDEVDGGS